MPRVTSLSRQGRTSTGLVLALLLILLVSLAACTSDGVNDGPRLTFQKESHDFGQVSAQQRMEYQFLFRNTGTRPLEINDIRLEPAQPSG